MLTWKVATIHMLKQQISPSARAAVLRHGLTPLDSSPSFSTNLYRPYTVAIAGEKGRKCVDPQSVTRARKCCFHFLAKGEMWLHHLWKVVLFYLEKKNKTKKPHSCLMEPRSEAKIPAHAEMKVNRPNTQLSGGVAPVSLTRKDILQTCSKWRPSTCSLVQFQTKVNRF